MLIIGYFYVIAMLWVEGGVATPVEIMCVRLLERVAWANLVLERAVVRLGK